MKKITILAIIIAMGVCFFAVRPAFAPLVLKVDQGGSSDSNSNSGSSTSGTASSGSSDSGTVDLSDKDTSQPVPLLR